METKIINIASRHEHFKEQSRLYHERILLLIEIINKWNNSESQEIKPEFYDYLIEIWKYKKSDNAMLLNILNGKLEFLQSEKKPEYRREIFMTKLQIEQSTLYPVIEYYSDEYIEMLKDEIKILESSQEPDLIKQNSDQINIFYKQDELNILQMGDPKFITKQQSDKIIEDKINKQYKVIINLLQERIDILTKYLNTGYFKDKLAVNSAKMEIHKLKAEIQAKREFIGQYKARKEIF